MSLHDASRSRQGFSPEPEDLTPTPADREKALEEARPGEYGFTPEEIEEIGKYLDTLPPESRAKAEKHFDKLGMRRWLHGMLEAVGDEADEEAATEKEKAALGQEWFTPAEACDYLRIGQTYMYYLLRTGEIPSVKVGRLRRVRRSDLDKFMEGRSA